jgi:hypothetical protein
MGAGTGLDFHIRALQNKPLHSPNSHEMGEL